jgi:hypothetical protein
MVCGGARFIGTSGNSLFPLKKRYSPFIFQKEILDKRFANRVNTELTKKRDRSRFFTVVSPAVGGEVAGSSVVAAGAGCWGGKGFRCCPFPTQFSEGAGRIVAQAGRCNSGHDLPCSDQVTAVRPFSRDGLAATSDRR